MKVLLLGATGIQTAIKTELLKRGIKVVGVPRSGSEISCDVSDENKLHASFFVVTMMQS